MADYKRICEMLREESDRCANNKECLIGCDEMAVIPVMLEEAAKVIEELMPKTGVWIDRPTKDRLRWQSWCSVCGKRSGIGGIKSNRMKPFCPNCGAKMEE